MKTAQLQISNEEIHEEENQDEKYYELEITPALEKYLLEVDEGKDILPQKYTDVEEMHRDILGYDYLAKWREK